MRRKILLLLPLVFLACNRGPAANQAAIAVSIDYDTSFQKGCVVVVARDDKGNEKSTDKIPSNKRPVDVAVFREDSWGRNLEVTVSAYEAADCSGTPVDTAKKSFTLDKAGNQTWSVALTAEDKDGDGFVAMRSGGGGTDCDDTHDKAHPGLTELCDGLDNDCQNGIDDGLPQNQFYLDADGDGVGAGAAVTACVAPPKHVTSTGDCDDSKSEVSPLKAEVCDGLDNNCSGGVDEGLPTKTYYRDADGDGFGDSTQSVVKCAPPAGYVEKDVNPVDCVDSDRDIHPGATEVCNDKDDNCVGGVDEGLDKTWYRDQDGDGFGDLAVTQLSCTPVPGYVKARPEGFDCNDAPGKQGVNPLATEICNGEDDNCKNGVDEGFNTGACTNDTCPGVYVCSQDGLSSSCNAQPPTLYYPDADGDGEGSAAPADVIKVCSGQTPPAGALQTNTDCDDKDSHNRSGGTEICDGRDNNCANETSDEATVCGGKGWKAVSETPIPSSTWNTVALGANGYPVWIAGDGGALAVRVSAGAAFTSYNSKCGNTNWNAAWVRPSDGTVFLAGSGGNLASYKAGDSACTTASTNSLTGSEKSNRALFGIIGFESGGTTVYVVNDQGFLYTWSGTGNPVYKFQRSGQPFYRDIHGASAAKLLVGGNDGTTPVLHGYDGISTSGSANHTLNSLPAGYSGQVNKVWAWDDTHAYAVGKTGLVLKWNGDTAWNYANPGGVSSSFTSVTAIDESSVYVTDDVGPIRRLTPGGWASVYTAGGPLRDIAVYPGATAWDIWAVGPGGVVVHFPE